LRACPSIIAAIRAVVTTGNIATRITVILLSTIALLIAVVKHGCSITAIPVHIVENPWRSQIGQKLVLNEQERLRVSGITKMNRCRKPCGRPSGLEKSK
jgi:hypothetical protein